jgi:carbamoyltransferase|tara:strand:+ start:1754 stop:3355 length:1602 start_codon:yes stop_codon:yes gene_type:complete
MSIIAGFHSGHDCSFCILKDGVPVIHAELERYIRLKEPIDDSVKFLFDKYSDFDKIDDFTTGIDIWEGGVKHRYPESWEKMQRIAIKNGGKIHTFGHHTAHAANAFFSSNLDKALIFTMDGGGEELQDNRILACTFAVYWGEGNKVYRIAAFDDKGQHPIANIGSFWTRCTKRIFGLSGGYPKGHQAGTVMGMACLGKPNYVGDFLNFMRTGEELDYDAFKSIADKSEQDTFDVAASLQLATEMRYKELLTPFVKEYNPKNICLSGGVSLNCVMAGKIYDWFPSVEDIYADPVPYDAGLTLGSARYLWHHVLDNPRIEWKDNSTPYLGEIYGEDIVKNTLESFSDKIKIQEVDDDFVVDQLIDKKIVSVFGGGSESGRRALGNRSILADPRHKETKDIVNERVKHRQWFRPFAPSILREEVKNWFTRDISSPYMSFAIPLKSEVHDKVPAIVHFDGTARLQTVTENDNAWYYNFIKKFNEKTGVPILLNTSFNDREPIVETPEHAIKCFLGTHIDYLYFREFGLLVERKDELQ